MAVPKRFPAKNFGKRFTISSFSLSILVFRVDFGVIACILDDGDKVDDDQSEQNDHADDVKQAQRKHPAEPRHLNNDFAQAWSKHQDDACDDANQPKLGRAKLRVCQPEFAFQMRVHRHVEGQHKIDHQKHTRDVEPHERRHARAQEHERFVDGINRVVDIEAIDGPLLLPDPS